MVVVGEGTHEVPSRPCVARFPGVQRLQTSSIHFAMKRREIELMNYSGQRMGCKRGSAKMGRAMRFLPLGIAVAAAMSE